jgi:hypothetical protein
VVAFSGVMIDSCAQIFKIVLTAAAYLASLQP